VAAMMGGQFDVTNQIPLPVHRRSRPRPISNVQELLSSCITLQDHAPHGSRQARAQSDEHRLNRADIVKGIMLGNV